MNRVGLLASLGCVLVAIPASSTPHVDAPKRVAPDANEGQVRARIAAGTTGFLVVWQAGVGPKAKVRAARVGLDGGTQDRAGFEIASGDLGHLEPAVAAGHGEYLVGWTVLRGGRSLVEAVVVGEDGKVRGAPVALGEAGGDQRSLDLAATDDGFLAAWSQFEPPVLGSTVRVATVDLAGQLVGHPLAVTSGKPWTFGENWFHLTNKVAEAQQPRLLVQGKRAVVTWRGSGELDPNGFVQTNAKVHWASIDLATWSASKAALVSFESYPQVWNGVVAPFADGWLFSWSDNLERGEAGPPSGNALFLSPDGGSSPVRFGVAATRVVRAPALSTNGLVAFVDWVRKFTDGRSWYENPLVLRDVAAPNDPDLVVDSEAAWPAFAVHASGATLLAWTRTGQHTDNVRLFSTLVSR